MGGRFHEVFQGEPRGATDGDEGHEEGKACGFLARDAEHEGGADGAAGAADAREDGTRLRQADAQCTQRAEGIGARRRALRQVQDGRRHAQHGPHKMFLEKHGRF